MLRHYKRSAILALALVLTCWSLIATHAWGWGQGGHRVVANIAYDQLEKPVRTRIVTMLREHHPDFKLRFEDRIAKELPNANPDDIERWIFLQASIWPDLIRSIP